MTFLYNCRHAGDEYKITKFDNDFNVESSYLCTLEECNCPAGHRPMCRHRDMLPKFIARGHIGDEWLWDHDRGGWVQGIPSEAIIAEADENIRDLTFALENPPIETATNLPLNSPPPLELAPQAIVNGQEAESNYIYNEEDCPGHVASQVDGKVCARCGTHIDSLRPEGNEPKIISKEEMDAIESAAIAGKPLQVTASTIRRRV